MKYCFYIFGQGIPAFRAIKVHSVISISIAHVVLVLVVEPFRGALHVELALLDLVPVGTAVK